MTTDYLKAVIEMIDRERRKACNEKYFNEGSKMYYEGMRVGLSEAQAFAEKMKELQDNATN